MNQQSKTWLLSILIFNIAITSMHYTDNAIFLEDYPEPSWITTSGVFISWVIMTSIAIMSYWLYARQNFWSSYLFLSIYSITGLSSPAHYLYGELSQFSVKMHAFIWSDVVAGLLVLGFVIWSILIARQWRITE